MLTKKVLLSKLKDQLSEFDLINGNYGLELKKTHHASSIFFRITEVGDDVIQVIGYKKKIGREYPEHHRYYSIDIVKSIDGSLFHTEESD